ncbi:MAG: peptidoglycan recognition family protein [Planctomycetota bacterium]
MVSGFLMTLAACAGDPGTTTGQAERPAVIPAAAWNSQPDPISESLRHVPLRVTVHHAGVTWKKDDDPYRKLVALQSWGKRDKGWPDVPYHFLVAPDGRIFEGRALAYEGETNTEYDVTGHVLVQLWGDFEVQRVSLPQLESSVRLIAWLCQQYQIPPAAIAGHLDWSEQTVCPGRDLYRYIKGGDLRGWVEETLKGARPQIELRRALPNGPTEFVSSN